MVSSSHSVSVWKKSFSLNAEESDLIVTVLTCFSIASVFSSVCLMASWLVSSSTTASANFWS